MTDRDLIAEARKLSADSEWPVPDRMIRPRCAALMNVVRELADALEAKTAQHAETLGLLEHAYEVIEAQNRPPLGYLVLSRTEDRLIPGAYRYTAACPITESVLPAERFVEEHAKRRKRYIVAGLLEIPHAK